MTQWDLHTLAYIPFTAIEPMGLLLVATNNGIFTFDIFLKNKWTY